ncbi:HAMP domain-containing histidine kinase [Curtobacterium flaccumfaciens pv. beticola]|uniref:sensor histidine kinase n=1 Tax=Curtobacterium flaccumfaciens TaxID=2035 RepID=UPI00349F2680|nr:HAMP domain-containing histidine kinase [Curtobacterium flaccumfaciens pv. basellae]
MTDPAAVTDPATVTDTAARTHRSPRRRGSLTGRTVATTVAVAVIAALAVAVVAFQLLRQESIGQTRLVLRSSAQAVAVAPSDERAAFAARIERRSGHRIDVGFGGDGEVVQLATPLPAGLEARLATATRLSVRQTDGWRTLLVEAVPARGGGSVVAVEDVSVLHQDTVLGRTAVALLVGVLVAVVLGIGVARLVTRPLRSAAAAATRLAGGERGVHGALPGATAAVREVAEIEQALGVLDAELARSEAAQREFLLSISHEFRTPLAAFRGYADALVDGLVPADDVARVGGVLHAETERLDAFVADLLALARTEADDFPVHPVDTDAVVLATDAVTAWSGRATTLGVRVRVASSVPAAPLRSDPQRVRQLLDGLLENALRVAQADGTVEVRVAEHPDGIALTVLDDGPGIDAGDLHRAFVRGALRDRHRSDRPVGTGLGLSIAARLAERLGGTIEAVPRTTGAEFRVVLPRSVGGTTPPRTPAR